MHSHVDRVRFQRSIAELISVVLQHTVIFLSNHIGPHYGVVLPPQTSAVSRHAVTTTDTCAHMWCHVFQKTWRVWEARVSQVRGRALKERTLPVGQVLAVFHCDRIRKLERNCRGMESKFWRWAVWHFVLCEHRSKWRPVKVYSVLETKKRLTHKSIELKVMAVSVLLLSYPLIRPRWPEFLWLVHCRHYRNRQAYGWWYSCGLPWQPLHGPALPWVFGLAWTGLLQIHVHAHTRTHTQVVRWTHMEHVALFCYIYIYKLCKQPNQHQSDWLSYVCCVRTSLHTAAQ